MNRNMEENMNEPVFPEIMVNEEENTGQYEQYSAVSCAFDSSVLLFAARKRGRGHIAKGQPCQDYALNAEMKYGAIMCAADGLGSCRYSNEGSRLACEAAVHIISEIARKAKSETMFVRKLAQIFTRKRIVMGWMDRVSMAFEERTGSLPENLYETAREYNSTLMCAVLTEHFIYVMNIGDGQILLFNQDYAYRLRPYMKKGSSVTDSLHDVRSWTEGFQTALFPRKSFSGILLSTDGIYDFLNEGQSFHRYACQIAERFVSAGKPSFPFDYVTEDGKTHHIYEGGSFDDCTVNLAVLMKPVPADPVHDFVCLSTSQNAVERMSRYVRRYQVIKNEKEMTMVTSMEIIDFHTDLAYLVKPDFEEDFNSRHYSLYGNIPFASVEEMYVSGKFNTNRNRDTKHLMRIGSCYTKLKELADELASQKRKLNEACAFLCGFDENGILMLCKEAVTFMEPEKPGERYAWFNMYFRNILGFFVFENRKIPVFRKGLDDQPENIERFDGLDHHLLGMVVSDGNTYELINRSGIDWVNEKGECIAEGQALPLDSHVSFTFQPRKDIRLTYHFVRKEDL